MQEEDFLKVMNKTSVRGYGKVVNAIGASEGLLTWWDKNCYKLLLTSENRHWNFVELEDLNIREFI